MRQIGVLSGIKIADERLVSSAGLEVILMDLDNVQDIEILRAICKKYMVKMKKGLCIQ